MKRLRLFFKLLLGLCLTQVVVGQTYGVGDVVENFSAPICQNGEGYWDYNTDGRNKVVWLNLFTSW